MPDFSLLAKNWNMYSSPWRPGESVVSFLDSQISTGEKVCILGSTQEFRLLAKNKKSLVDIYDISPEMIHVNDVGNTKESVYIQDWFSISDKKYDIILGDLVTFFLDKKQQEQLLKILQSNLSENGKILLRTGEPLDSQQEQDLINTVVEQDSDFLTFLNYISFEFIVGQGWSTQEIQNLLKSKNINIFNYFQEHFLELVPYGEVPPMKTHIGEQGKKIYSKEYLLSKEVILEFS